MVRRTYPSATVAEQVRRAVAADNPTYVRGSVVGATLEYRLEATHAASARATLDDLLACVSAAERSLDLAPTSTR
ncbi:MAG: KEOPS complex subunit Pcc1 [Thermoplasmata archaeon]